MDVLQIVVAVAAIAAVGVSLVTLLHTRKKDDTEIKAEAEVVKFDELVRMNGVLRDGLLDAQGQAEELSERLARAQADMNRLNVSLTTALANVTLLNDFIDQHVPAEIARPTLRRMLL